MVCENREVWCEGNNITISQLSKSLTLYNCTEYEDDEIINKLV